MCPTPRRKRSSQSEYARHRAACGLPGQPAAAVSKAVRDGRITLGSDGRGDPAIADVEWRENTDPGYYPAARDPDAGDVAIDLAERLEAALPERDTWNAEATRLRAELKHLKALPTG